MKPRIAIAGKSGSGKTALAEALAKRYEIPRDSFAAPIRWALLELGVGAPFPRMLMQGIGELVRRWNPDHFVDLLELRHLDWHETGLVIDDLRYENEYQRLRRHGFIMVYLEGSFRPLQGAEAEHESENSLTPEVVEFDLVLPAGSSLEQRLAAIALLVGEPSAEAVS